MIFILAGRSCSGKDTIYKELLKNDQIKLNPIIPYTTRPMREGEVSGREYHFVTEERFDELSEKGLVIESRSYNTTKGVWIYFTVDQDIDPDKDYLMIGTLPVILALQKYYKDKILITPIIMLTYDETLLQRAFNREKQQKNPDYAEMCRRFLADKEDYSEEKLTMLKRYSCVIFSKNSNNKTINESVLEIVKIITEIDKLCEIDPLVSTMKRWNLE